MKLPRSSKKSKIDNLELNCQNFFSKRDILGKEFWKSLDEHMPECCCERVSVNSLSPGMIEATEQLVSAIMHSNYVDPSTGKAWPTIAERLFNGLSVDRVQYTDCNSFNQRAQTLVLKYPNKEYLGVIVFSTRKLRSIVEKGNRCFAVYDTAIPENRSHSEIVQTNYPNDTELTQKERKMIRYNIREILVEALDYEGRVLASQEIFTN